MLPAPHGGLARCRVERRSGAALHLEGWITVSRFAPGMRIGDYSIERELGAEEACAVYLGHHAVLPRQAALKVMHRGAEAARPGVSRVLREAYLLESLSHPGIPRVFECGILPDGRSWAAFERIEGTSLGTLLVGGPMAPAEVAVVLRDVGDLLAHAHARNVVHRRLTADAIVRATDRGAAVCVRHWAEARVAASDPRADADPRADMHALGAAMLHALAGAALDLRAPPPAAEVCAAAPAELTSLIDQMLADDPASRPPADEVCDRARWLSDTIEPRMSDRLRWSGDAAGGGRGRR
jgi:tRNA A-37 threonylcarbamoyl transferase component Bud32